MNSNIPVPLLGVREFAKLSGLAEYTVRKMCRDGILPSKKLGSRWFVSTKALEI